MESKSYLLAYQNTISPNFFFFFRELHHMVFVPDDSFLVHCVARTRLSLSFYFYFYF